MDVGSKKGYPASAVSNFPAHPFTLDGVDIASMEGLLQALKNKNPEMQKAICQLSGMKAKRKGFGKKWWRDGKLYWQGREMDRYGKEYQEFLDRAYLALYTQNEGARKALLATGNAVLTHSVGKNDPTRTVLTVQEFCSRLMWIRGMLQSGEI
jgi:predicted NAD-dependent protein-ADP-ribosyltransferase YbiA (DUF1768 family)